MSKAAQKQRKSKAVAPEPTPILLEQESATIALSRGDDSDPDMEDSAGKDDGVAMPHADMFFSTQIPVAAADASTDSAAPAANSEMAMLTQQLQLMQQIIMMQQQQMQQQLQQHKAELDETKKLLLAGAPAAASATSAPGVAAETPSFTAFRTSVPDFPHQKQTDDTDAAVNTLRGRLGMVNDSIVAPSSRQDFSHMTEFQLGSRYVIKGLGLM